MLIADYLAAHATTHPDEIALTELQPTNPASDQPRGGAHLRRVGQLTWREFDDAANRCANMLRAHGVQHGDHVAILMHNCVDWLPIYFGILKAGAVAVPINTSFAPEKVADCVAQADVTLMFFADRFINFIDSIRSSWRDDVQLIHVGTDCPPWATNYHTATQQHDATAPQVAVTDSDNATIYFSSGTTGPAKAILHNHRSLHNAAIVEQHHHGQHSSDVFLCVPPLFHAGAKIHWFGSLISRGAAVLMDDLDPRTILGALSQERCTIVWLTVPCIQNILVALEDGQIDPGVLHLDQVRLMHAGAQPVADALVARWLAVFPNQQYDTNYGLTEAAGPGCVHLGVENTTKVGAIGRAGHGWETRIVDDENRPVPPGDMGELAVRGGSVMSGYYGDPAATAAVLPGDGWLLTGDLAREDRDGFIWMVGRKKEMIITSGVKVHPGPIENVLADHEAVKDAAVLGIPDPHRGEIVTAVIELRDGMQRDTQPLAAHCEQLPPTQRPQQVVFAPVVRNATGKIDRATLTKQLLKATAKDISKL